MPIKIACTCGKQFAVKDETAGKTVKCPRCSQPVVVPSATTTGDEYGLSDLFDEAGMKAARAGAPRCPSCGAETTPGAVICIECGYNSQLGRRMETYAEADGGGSHAEQLVRKAEKDLESSPLTQTEEQYGEGGSSYLLTCGMMVVAAVMLGVGFVVVLIASQMNTIGMMIFSLLVMVIAAFFCAVYITVIAFLEDVRKGIGCLVSLLLFYFGGILYLTPLGGYLAIPGRTLAGAYLLIYGYQSGRWIAASVFGLFYIAESTLLMIAIAMIATSSQ